MFRIAECKMKEYHCVDQKPDSTGSDHGQNEPPPLQRRIDREIGKLGENECRDRSYDQRRRGNCPRQYSPNEDCSTSPSNSEPPLNKVSQDESQAHQENSTWSHQSGSDRYQAGAIGDADGANISNRPVRCWYAECERDKERKSLPLPLDCSRDFNSLLPCALKQNRPAHTRRTL